MDLKTYGRLANRTQAPQQEILLRLQRLGDLAMQMDNAARGLANDCGEVAEIVKNVIEYGRPFNDATRQHMIEELGDVLWRVNQMCGAIGVGMDEVAEANIRKLTARYPEKYSDEAANNRDKEKEKAAIALPPGASGQYPPVQKS